MDLDTLHLRADHQPGVEKDVPHPMVFTERLRFEACDTFRTRSTRELLEEMSRGSVSLPRVGDDERDFCNVGARDAVETAHRDDVAIVEHDERFPLVMVDMREAFDFGRREVRMQDEESEACRLVRQSVVEVDERVRIAG